MIASSSVSSSTPNLEAVWLASYIAGDNNIRWLPILPSGDRSISVLERNLSDAFSLEIKDGNINISEDFLKVLEDNNYWWSGYIVLEEHSLVQVLRQLGRIEVNGYTFTTNQVMEQLPIDLGNPQAAYEAQTAVLQSACRKLSQILNQTTWPQNFPNFPQNLITDLDTELLRAEISSMVASNQQLTCRFPMLEISGIGQ